jgi:hypothetical protein
MVVLLICAIIRAMKDDRFVSQLYPKEPILSARLVALREIDPAELES